MQTQLLGCVLPSKGTVFRGCLKSKRGISGIVCVSQFRLSTTITSQEVLREHSFVWFCSLHKPAHMRDMLVCVVWYLSNTEIAPAKSAVSFNATYVSHTRCVSHRSASKNVDGREHEGSRVASINIPRLSSWSLRSIDHCVVISFYFRHCSWFIKLSAGQRTVRALSKIKPVKWVLPKYSPRGGENWKFRRALEGVTIEDIGIFDKYRRIFWGRILWIEFSNKSLWKYVKCQLSKVTNVSYPPRPKDQSSSP